MYKCVCMCVCVCVRCVKMCSVGVIDKGGRMMVSGVGGVILSLSLSLSLSLREEERVMFYYYFFIYQYTAFFFISFLQYLSFV